MTGIARIGIAGIGIAATGLVAAAALLVGAASAFAQGGSTPTSQELKRDVLIGADMWKQRPRMLAAGLGFTETIGVPGLSTDDLAASERAARAAGGTWNTIECSAGRTRRWAPTPRP